MWFDSREYRLDVLVHTGLNIDGKTDEEIAAELYKLADPSRLRNWALDRHTDAMYDYDGREFIAMHGFKGISNFNEEDFIEDLCSTIGSSDGQEFIDLYNEIVNGK